MRPVMHPIKMLRRFCRSIVANITLHSRSSFTLDRRLDRPGQRIAVDGRCSSPAASAPTETVVLGQPARLLTVARSQRNSAAPATLSRSVSRSAADRNDTCSPTLHARHIASGRRQSNHDARRHPESFLLHRRLSRPQAYPQSSRIRRAAGTIPDTLRGQIAQTAAAFNRSKLALCMPIFESSCPLVLGEYSSPGASSAPTSRVSFRSRAP